MGPESRSLRSLVQDDDNYSRGTMRPRCASNLRSRPDGRQRQPSVRRDGADFLGAETGIYADGADAAVCGEELAALLPGENASCYCAHVGKCSWHMPT